MHKTIILGGGLTGLSLGYFLNQKNEDFLILEKDTETGGLMRSIEKEGFTFDFGGSHIIFSKDEEVLEFMIKLLGNNKVKSKRNTKVLFKNRFVKYPFENGLSDLPVEDNFECLDSFIRNYAEVECNKKKEPKNFEEWMYYNFGEGITKKYLLPYNRKIWKFEPKKMSLEWVSRVPKPPLSDIIRSSLGISTEGYTHQLYFYYPLTGGIQAITNLMEADQKEKIIKDCEIKKISKEKKGWKIFTSKGEFECEKLISTIPIFSLVKLLEAPKNVKEAASGLKFNSLVSVMLGIKNQKINDFSWLYLPDEKILTHRISFPSNYSPKNSPKGCSSILAEITYNEGDKIDKTPDKEITERTIKDLCELGIIKKSEVCYSDIKRVKYAYVVYDLDYYKNTKIIRDWFSKLGIDLLGRFSYYDYLNMDGCIGSVMDYLKTYKV